MLPSQSVPSTVYFEIAVIGHGRSVEKVAACGYRNITAQRDKRRSVCRSTACLQGSEQSLVGSDSGSGTAYRHFIRNRSAIAPTGDFGSGQFHLGLSRLLILFQRKVKGEPLAAFETSLVTGFGSIQVGRYIIVPRIIANLYPKPFRTCGQVLRCHFPVGIATALVRKRDSARCATIVHRTGQQINLHAGKHRRRIILCCGVYQGRRQICTDHALSGNQFDNKPMHQMFECQCHRLTLTCCGSGVEQVVRIVQYLRHIHVCRRIDNGFRDTRVVGGESHRFRFTEIFPIKWIAVVGLVSNVFVTVCRRCGISRKSVHAPFVGRLERAFAICIELRRACLYSLYVGSDVYCAFGQGIEAWFFIIVVASRQCQCSQHESDK